MINNVFELLKQNSYFFDTESLGLVRGQGIYEFSAVDPGGTSFNIYKNINDNDLLLSSAFSKRSAYQQRRDISSGKIKATPQFGQQVATYMLSQHKQRRYAVAHNINFDLSVIGEELQSADPKGGMLSYMKTLFGQGSTEELSASFFVNKNLKASSRFSSIAHTLAMAQSKGMPLAVDSLAIAQSFIGMGYERGIIKPSIAGLPADEFTGSNLRVLQKAFGIQSAGAAHTGSSDVGVLKQLFPKLIDASLELFHNKSVSKDTISALTMIGKYQKEIADINLKSNILEHAYQWRRPFYPEMEALAKEFPEKYGFIDLNRPGHFNLKTEYGARRLPFITPDYADEFAWLSLGKYSQKGIYQRNYGYTTNDFVNLYSQSAAELDDLLIKGGHSAVEDYVGSFKNIQEESLLKRMSLEDADFKIPEGIKVGAPSRAAKATPMTSRTKAGLMIAGGGLAAIAAASIFSGRDDDYNVIEGMRHEGVAGQNRKKKTDFGSGWRGLFNTTFDIAGSIAGLFTPSKIMEIGKSAASGLKQELHQQPGWAIGFGAYGLYSGYKEGKKSGKISAGGFVRNIALDMADDVLIFAAADIGKQLPFLEKIRPVLESGPVKTAGVSFFGYTVGKIIGETAGVISGKDDSYNTIEGLRHSGISGATRRYNTDFGSGWQGLKNLFGSLKKTFSGPPVRPLSAKMIKVAEDFGYALEDLKKFNHQLNVISSSKKINTKYYRRIDRLANSAENKLGSLRKNNEYAWTNGIYEDNALTKAMIPIESTMVYGKGIKSGFNKHYDSLKKQLSLIQAEKDKFYANSLVKDGALYSTASKIKIQKNILKDVVKNPNDQIANNILSKLDDLSVGQETRGYNLKHTTKNVNLDSIFMSKRILPGINNAGQKNGNSGVYVSTNTIYESYGDATFHFKNKENAFTRLDEDGRLIPTELATVNKNIIIKKSKILDTASRDKQHQYLASKGYNIDKRLAPRKHILVEDYELEDFKGISSVPTKIVADDKSYTMAFTNAELAGAFNFGKQSSRDSLIAMNQELSSKFASQVYIKGGTASAKLEEELLGRIMSGRQKYKDIDLLVTGSVTPDEVYGVMNKHNFFADVSIHKDLDSAINTTDFGLNQAYIKVPSAQGKTEIFHTNAAFDDITNRKITVFEDNLTPDRRSVRVSKMQSYYPGSEIRSSRESMNTIPGMREGGVAGALRSIITDFGSPYQGLNNLSPSYNTAKDMMRYQQVRASQIGLSESEMYKWMTEDEESQPSAYVQASADAGTALHMLRQSERFASGEITDAEKLVYTDGIAGHIDVISNAGIGDIKTVDSGIFQTIKKEGPKPSHLAQVQYYLGATGSEQGYIEYINRDNPKQSKLFMIDYNEQKYKNLIKKVERAKFRVERDLNSGILNPDDMPKTASLERLIDYDAQRETPEEQANAVLNNTLLFNEQMKRLRGIKRGMPRRGTEAYERVQQRQKKKRSDFFNTSTQGIGLQMYNDRINHHMM